MGSPGDDARLPASPWQLHVGDSSAKNVKGRCTGWLPTSPARPDSMGAETWERGSWLTFFSPQFLRNSSYKLDEALDA